MRVCRVISRTQVPTANTSPSETTGEWSAIQTRGTSGSAGVVPWTSTSCVGSPRSNTPRISASTRPSTPGSRSLGTRPT